MLIKLRGRGLIFVCVWLIYRQLMTNDPILIRPGEILVFTRKKVKFSL